MDYPTNPRAVALPVRAGRLLVFDHPLAGPQFVKGRIEPGESPANAAIRELREEAGVDLNDPRPVGIWDAQPAPWHVFRFDGADLPDSWAHHCADDGGHLFTFRWHDPAQDLGDGAHAVFTDLLSWLRGRV